MLLAGGAVADCTAVVLEILDLLLRTNNRHAEILPLVDHMFDTYCETNLPVNVLQGWAYAHGRASEGKLTAGDVEKFRQFQRILPVHPSAWFYSLLDPLWRP